ncbi:hypothetical protein U9M48_034292 [Paspalum notatum var. saurae]|uniref:Uncharacterized protein n=1 Tax=Paspalum notatum var. saurae TaxID=547442 RepID=A0AAQ3UD97_PASNO
MDAGLADRTAVAALPPVSRRVLPSRTPVVASSAARHVLPPSPPVSRAPRQVGRRLRLGSSGWDPASPCLLRSRGRPGSTAVSSGLAAGRIRCRLRVAPTPGGKAPLAQRPRLGSGPRPASGRPDRRPLRVAPPVCFFLLPKRHGRRLIPLLPLPMEPLLPCHRPPPRPPPGTRRRRRQAAHRRRPPYLSAPGALTSPAPQPAVGRGHRRLLLPALYADEVRRQHRLVRRRRHLQVVLADLIFSLRRRFVSRFFIHLYAHLVHTTTLSPSSHFSLFLSSPLIRLLPSGRLAPVAGHGSAGCLTPASRQPGARDERAVDGHGGTCLLPAVRRPPVAPASIPLVAGPPWRPLAGPASAAHALPSRLWSAMASPSPSRRTCWPPRLHLSGHQSQAPAPASTVVGPPRRPPPRTVRRPARPPRPPRQAAGPGASLARTASPHASKAVVVLPGWTPYPHRPTRQPYLLRSFRVPNSNQARKSQDATAARPPAAHLSCCCTSGPAACVGEAMAPGHGCGKRRGPTSHAATRLANSGSSSQPPGKA